MLHLERKTLTEMPKACNIGGKGQDRTLGRGVISTALPSHGSALAPPPPALRSQSGSASPPPASGSPGSDERNP